MKEQQLFEVLGQIDEKYVAAAQRNRGKRSCGRQEYSIEPERPGGPLRWVALAACLLAVALMVGLIPHMYRGGVTATEPQVTLDVLDMNIVQPETTSPKEVDPYYEPAPYIVEFPSVEDYWRLREAVDLPDEHLQSFLRENGLCREEGGIQDRQQLEKFIEDTQYLPIPSLPGDTLKSITITEYTGVAVFEYSSCTMEVALEQDEEQVRHKTRGMELIFDFEGYPLYLGSENAGARVCYLDLWMNAEGYLVRISAETDDPVGFLASLEEITFQFPEAVSVGRPEGEYGGPMDGYEWHFAEQTGTLTFSPLGKNARVDAYMIYRDAPWVDHAEKITSLVVEEGIVALGNQSVTRLPKLQTVRLPESLVSIGDEVFAGCALQTLHIPAAVTNIGIGFAANCEQLQTVEMDGWQPQIGRRFLENCPQLYRITLGCSSGYWEQVVLPANPHLVGVAVGVAMVGDYDLSAVYDEKGMLWSYQTETASLTVQGSGVAGVAPAAILMVWNQVQELVISEGITAVEDGFAEMTKLRSVSLPSTLEELPSFYGCKSLEAVTVPARIGILPNMAFSGCAKLKTIILPEGLTRIENMAFGNCGALEYIAIPDGVGWIGQSAFYACLSLKEIRLPQSLKRLKEGTFHECVQLEKVTLPADLVDIEPHCFEGCSSIKTLAFTGSQAKWDALLNRCADAIPEGVAVEVEVTPTEEPKIQKTKRFSPLWVIVPIAVLAMIVTEIVVGKRRK